MYLNPAWVESIEKKIADFVAAPHTPINEIVSLDLAAKWLVARLAKLNIAYRVENLGAGVKKITTDTTACPKCHGTGKI